MATATVRDILAEQRSGVSRAGLLAWCRLRIDPSMTEAQLDAELAALADQVVSESGFLRLRDPGGAPTGSADIAAGRPFDWSPPTLATLEPGPETPEWTPPRSGTSAALRLAMVAAGIVAAVVIFGLSWAIGEDATFPSGSAGPVTPAGSTVPGATVIDAYDLSVGDCVMAPDEEFDELERRPCTQPHEAEVFLVQDMLEGEDASFPAEEAFETYVATECDPAFASYTGSDFDTQELLDMTWFTPTESSWEAGDREIVCLLTPIDGGTTDRSWRSGSP